VREGGGVSAPDDRADSATADDRLRKQGGPRTCYGKYGKPKASFATKKQAEKAIPRTSAGLGAYRCEEHGWHLGH
jgi:hypothetical protein